MIDRISYKVIAYNIKKPQLCFQSAFKTLRQNVTQRRKDQASVPEENRLQLKTLNADFARLQQYLLSLPRGQRRKVQKGIHEFDQRIASK